MVLHGAQFHRSGPARCEFLTRRVLPFVLCRILSMVAHGLLHATWNVVPGRERYWQSYKGLAPDGASR